LVEWIFAFETRRIVSRSKIDNVVDDIVKLLEYAKGFPQEHLMSAGQLLLNRISDNVGGVKHLLSTLQHALVEERHFALVEGVALLHQPRLARNPYSGLELGPTQASLRSRTAIMITSSNSSSL
jgi:hypothetical protein